MRGPKWRLSIGKNIPELLGISVPLLSQFSFKNEWNSWPQTTTPILPSINIWFWFYLKHEEAKAFSLCNSWETITIIPLARDLPHLDPLHNSNLQVCPIREGVELDFRALVISPEQGTPRSPNTRTHVRVEHLVQRAGTKSRKRPASALTLPICDLALLLSLVCSHPLSLISKDFPNSIPLGTTSKFKPAQGREQVAEYQNRRLVRKATWREGLSCILVGKMETSAFLLEEGWIKWFL